MKKLIFGAFVVAVVCIPGISPKASAAIPQMMNYQGKLTTATGNLVTNGQYDMKFAIYNDETGGTLKWSETWDTSNSRVQVTNGLFNVLLGKHTELDIPFDANYWLEVQVEYSGSYELLLPRQQLVSTGYAFRAEKVTDGAITNASISPSAAIADTKLLTISTAGKVAGSAVSGTLAAVNGSAVTDLNGGNITSGNLGVARLPGGGNWVLTSALGITGGNVGIGTAAPNENLEIYENTSPVLRLNAGTYVAVPASLTIQGGVEFENNATDKIAGIYGAVPPSSHTPGILFQVTAAWNGPIHQMYMHPSGNVGIGTTGPAQKLEVYNGNFLLNSTTNHYLMLANTLSARTYTLRSGSDGIFWLEDLTAGTAPFKIEGAAPTGALVIKSTTGNVGIGTASPSLRLHVAGTADGNPATSGTVQNGCARFRSGSNAVLDIGQQSSGWLGTWLQSTDQTGLNATYSLSLNPNGGNVGIGTTSPSMRLYVNGSSGGTGAWNGSDMRWKKNIRIIPEALERITELRGVSYEWRKDEFKDRNFDEGTQLGLIAQEVEKVFPELIKDAGGYKHLNYNGLLGPVIEAIKELKFENDSLKSRLEAMEVQLNAGQ